MFVRCGTTWGPRFGWCGTTWGPRFAKCALTWGPKFAKCALTWKAFAPTCTTSTVVSRAWKASSRVWPTPTGATRVKDGLHN